MSERRKVWTVVQTRGPGEKGERVGGAQQVGQFATEREAQDAYWSIRKAGGAAYVAQREV